VPQGQSGSRVAILRRLCPWGKEFTTVFAFIRGGSRLIPLGPSINAGPSLRYFQKKSDAYGIRAAKCISRRILPC
jgi:hypothetical protein